MILQQKHKHQSTRPTPVLQVKGHTSIGGFTLVELLISIVLGLFMTAAVIQTYLMTKNTYRTTQQVSRVQENSRFSMYFIGKAIRESGNRGCVDELRSMLNDSSYFDVSKPIIGWDFNGTNANDTYALPSSLNPNSIAVSSWSKAAPNSNLPSIFADLVVPGTDMFIVQNIVERDDIALKHSSPTSSTTLSTATAHGIDNGQILIVTDCSNNSADMFQHHNNNNASNLNASPTNSYIPGNKGLSSNVWSAEWGPDSHLLQNETTAYFIGYNVDNEPALFSANLGGGLAALSIVPIEMVDGVENMQVVYGEDINADRFANRYVSANQVSDWSNVVSVRVSLLMRSPGSAVDEVNTDTYRLAENITINPADDRLLRYVATSTIKIRNRGLVNNIRICEAEDDPAAEGCRL